MKSIHQLGQEGLRKKYKLDTPEKIAKYFSKLRKKAKKRRARKPA